MTITMAEINGARIAGRMTRADVIYKSGDNHGVDSYGTMKQWKRVIPADEQNARATGFWDWYESDARYEDGMEWAEYRLEILSQLIRIEV